MFRGLAAFPLTPMNEDSIDEAAFVRLVRRLAAARVNCIGALGSTGSYAYLTRAERARVAEIAVQNAEGIPVIVGIGALRTRDVIQLAEDAQRAGAGGVLLAPVSYQKLTDDEVYGLYEAVTRSLSVPLCVYDNPGTTNFSFSDELHGRIAQLPRVLSIKIPGVPGNPADAKDRVYALRERIPQSVSIGVSGDAHAAAGLNAGCDGWYSVLAGLFPKTCMSLTSAALSGNSELASQLSARLEPLWEMFRRFNGSIRVVATAAVLLGLASEPNLPLPMRGLDTGAARELREILRQLELRE
ncbi:dihydrodipicolinate synthase family protein [Caballeronia sp. GAFFF1]|uniref:dihydrodipicolinate synthase family protein n=1 Tax=Caballeronia sp. GAFFF1 TaxID=2921779 RepID=UPI002541B55F|nr:dihydrodipicolinate synthase family protein [Caballeronia sp. GAFFF1]